MKLSFGIVGIITGIVLTILEALGIIHIGRFWATFAFWIYYAVWFVIYIIMLILVAIGIYHKDQNDFYL